MLTLLVSTTTFSDIRKDFWFHCMTVNTVTAKSAQRAVLRYLKQAFDNIFEAEVF